jgi:AraC family transcriptional regulator
MDGRIQKVLDFIEKNLERHLSLAELAPLINLSDSRFRHLFTVETGVSPRVYLRKLRLARARQFLDEGRLNIDQIALKVGWQDRSHFERRFKQVYGVTPAQYRNARRSEARIKENPLIARAAIK